MEQLPLGVRLRDRASFASFVVGRNAELVGLLEALSGGESPPPARIVFVHGPQGAGKSHLLQAATAQAGSRFRAGYVALPDLADTEASVLDGWQGLDFLAIDDLQAVAGAPPWDAALFRLHRDFDERRAVLILASESAPTSSEWRLPDLRTRLGAASVYALQELDEAGRMEALKTRAALRGVELPPETLRYLQRRFPRDMRSMYLLLDTLDDAALSAQRRLTVPFVREVLGSEGG